MSDLSTRARQIATKEGLLLADPHRAKTDLLLGIFASLSEINPYEPLTAQSKEWAEVVFKITVLSSLFGIDIVDAVQAAIDQKELTGKPRLPGTAAPVPNAKTNDGTLRDPSGTEPIDWNG